MDCFFATTLRASSLLVFIACIICLPVYGGECKGTVYLTFDTGNMDQAEYIARVLKKNNIKATFFLANTPTRKGGTALDKHWQAYWQDRVKEGHTFGTHTWSHFYVQEETSDNRVKARSPKGKQAILDEEQYCRELHSVEEQFKKLTGVGLQAMWRAPGGKTTGKTLRWANDCGYPIHVGWDPAGYIGDDRPVSRGSNQYLLGKALSSIKAGDIILMHLGIWNRETPLAPVLPALIKGLQKRDLCFGVIRAGAR